MYTRRGARLQRKSLQRLHGRRAEFDAGSTARAVVTVDAS
jgi:hypothetical protein